MANGDRRVRGVDIVVMVNISEDDQTENWIAAGGQQNATLSETSEAIDATAKDSERGAYQYEYGLYGWTISADGLYVPDNEAFSYLRQAMRERKKVKVQIMEEDVPTEEGLALVSSLELEAPYDGMATYTMEFQGTGFLRTVENGGTGVED